MANEPKRISLSTLAEALTNAVNAARSTFTNSNLQVINAGEPMKPREADGEAVPLQYQYQHGYNLTVNERKKLTPFDVLRQLADNHDLTRIAIETRKEQISGMAWDIVPAQKDDKNDYAEQVKVVRQFFKKPDRVNTFYDWIGMVLEEVLVIDALTIYRRRTKGGQMFGIDIVDGSTIKPLIDSKGRTPLPPLPAYQQIIFGYPQSEYTIEEMLYKPKNKRVWTPYGFSPVEYIIMSVNIALRREQSYLSYYTEGTTPDGGLYEVPDTWTVDQIRKYQEYWDAMLSGNMGKRQGMRFVPRGGYHATKDFKFDSAFDEWLARLVANAFGVDPQIFIKQQNRATAQQSSDVQTDIGLKPLTTFLEGVLTDIIQEDLGFPDLAFRWVEEKAADEALQISKNVQYVQAGIYSRDEVRISEGREPSVTGGMPPFIMRGDGTPLFMNDEMFERYKEPPEVPAQLQDVNAGGKGEGVEDDDEPVDDNKGSKQPKQTDGAHSKPTDKKTPEPPKSADKAIMDELRQWEKFAVNRFGKNGRAFEYKAVPSFLAKRLQMDIELAESADEIKAIFKDAAEKPFRSTETYEKEVRKSKKD